MEVRIIPYYKQTFRVSFLLVGRIVCQETQQSRAPTPAGLNIGMSTGIRVSQGESQSTSSQA